MALFSLAELNSIVSIEGIFLIHSSVDRHLADSITYLL